MMTKKRGIFFSIDALIALTAILLIVLIAYPIYKETKFETEIHQDTITTLSSLKAVDIINDPIRTILDDNEISDNKTLIEAIGELYIIDKQTGTTTYANQVAQEILDKIDTTQNISIFYDNNEIASTADTSYENANPKNIDTARQIISGIGNSFENEESAITGFSAQASLKSSNVVEYAYFGGYVGNGDITTTIEFDGTATSAEMEIVINHDFTVTINGGTPSGTFTKSPNEFTPATYSLSTTDFISGSNSIKISPASSASNTLHITGGLIKVTYDPDENAIQYEQPTRYYFPRIDGTDALVNIFDGFYIPADPTEMEISLHAYSPDLPVILSIGNTEIYNGIINPESTITFDDATLKSNFGGSYSGLGQKTIPLRFGLVGTEYTVGLRPSIEVMSVTDTSGSMSACTGGGYFCCLFNDCWESQQICESCGGTWGDDKMQAAKDANELFIQTILAEPEDEHLVGLVGYDNTASPDQFHELSDDETSLMNIVNSWAADGSTRTCDGINKAVDELNISTGFKIKSIVVMSDGAATASCTQQGYTQDLNNNGQENDHGDDAVQAACDAYESHDITVHAIAFGEDADTDTMQAIASCGGGTYAFANLEDLLDVYDEVAEEILAATYYEQEVVATSGVESALYEDSYIEFIYSAPQSPFGLILSNEVPFEDENSTTFAIPDNSKLMSTKVVSYSGTRWTNKVINKTDTAFDLNDYGTDYLSLGDPFVIDIPNSYINTEGDINLINLSTGLSLGNTEAGSIYNKLIYTIVKNASAFAPISAITEGCTWDITFVDDSTLTFDAPADYQENFQQNFCDYATSSYDSNDAYQSSVYNLLKQLDFDSNEKIDTYFTEEDLVTSAIEVADIPFTWSIEVQVRVWS